MTLRRDTESIDPRRTRSGGWRAVAPGTTATIRIGHASGERRRQVLAWLNEGLRPDRPGRLVREYPLVFGRSGSSSSEAVPIVAWRQERPVAFATLWPVDFRIGAGQLRVGLISHVFTDPACRGQGHATRVLQAAIEHAAQLDRGLLLLWSELDGFYRSLGFERAGEESLVVLDRETVARALGTEATTSNTSVESARVDDWVEIERLRGLRTSQMELDPRDVHALAGVPDLDVQVARGPSGVVAFAIRGRGDDLQEVIHEWGGRPDAALACCRALLERAAPWNELFLMAPAARDELAWRLRRAGARVIRQPLGWMRVASPSAFAEDLNDLLPDQDDLRLAMGTNETRITVSSHRGECEVDPHALLEGLFGSGRASDPATVRRHLRPVLGERAVRRLPIPFHVAGLESI